MARGRLESLLPPAKKDSNAPRTEHESSRMKE
jgi:hypothetical protein